MIHIFEQYDVLTEVVEGVGSCETIRPYKLEIDTDLIKASAKERGWTVKEYHQFALKELTQFLKEHEAI